nr:hypothetical protein Iba_chr08fCG3450 [Ipomoea batatas]
MESRLGRGRPKVDKVDHEVSHDSGSTIVVDYDIGDGDHEEAQLTRSAPRSASPLDGPVGRLSGTTSDGGQQKSGIISEFGMNMNIGKFLRERAAMFVSNKESCEFCRLLDGNNYVEEDYYDDDDDELKHYYDPPASDDAANSLHKEEEAADAIAA